MRGAHTVAVGDGGKSLDVRAEHLLERTSFCLAQLRELGRDMRDRAVVLTDLHARHTDAGLPGGLCRRSVAMGRERPSEGFGAGGERRIGIDALGQPGSEALGAMLGESHHGLLPAGLAQITQRGVGEVVVGVRERGPAVVGEGVDPSRAPAPTMRCRTGIALDQQTVGDQGVEMATDRCRGQAELFGKCRGALWAALEQAARHRVASAVTRPVAGAIGVHHGTVRDFHNISMTYFELACTGPCRSGGR